MSEFAFPSEGLELLRLSHETQVVLGAVLAIAPTVVDGQRTATQSLEIKPADKTPVTEIDKATNIAFNAIVESAFGGKAEVIGEEVSLSPAVPLEAGEDKIVITLDSIDGTGEYVANYRDRRTGDPVYPGRPQPPQADLEPILDHERTTCIGASIFKNGKLQASVVLNPFTKQLVVADRDMEGAFLVPADAVESGDISHGQRLAVSARPFERDNTPWDCAVWPSAPVDVQFLTEIAGQPRNNFSAISQAVDVALGKSVGAVFAGETLHDIAPSVATVLLAGGVVATPNGVGVTMENLLDIMAAPRDLVGNPSAGFVYTTPTAYEDFMRALNSDREVSPYIAAADGWFFSPTYTGMTRIKTVEDIVKYEEDEGVEQRNRIFINSFGPFNGDYLRRRDFKEVRRRTRELGGSWLSYKLEPLDTDMPNMHGYVRVWQPNRAVEISPGITMTASDLALAAIRSMVAYRIHEQQEKR